MNVLKSFKDKEKAIKFFYTTVREIYYDIYREYMYEKYTPQITELFYKDFKDNLKTIRAFNYYVDSVNMYENDFGNTFTVYIKNEILKENKYAISFNLRWW